MRSLLASTIATLLFSTACTDSPADDDIDAIDDDDGGDQDAPTTTIRVTDDELFIPAAGVTVVVASADGTITSVVTTDDEGIATAEVERDAQVTVVTSSPTKFSAMTRKSVQPGDDIQFGIKLGEYSLVAAVEVTWPRRTGNEYEVISRCGTLGRTTEGKGTLYVDSGCALGQPLDVVVIKREAGSLDTVGVLTASLPALADGATLAVTGTFAPAKAYTSSFFAPYNAQVGGTLNVLAGNHILFMDTASGYSDTEVALDYKVPTLPGTELAHSVSVRDAQVQTSSKAYGRRMSAVSNVSFPLEHPIARLAVQPFDTANRRLSWTATGESTHDAERANVTYIRAGVFYDWTVIGPGSSTPSGMTAPSTISATLPALPDEFASAYPTATDDVFEKVDYLDVMGHDFASMSARLAETSGQYELDWWHIPPDATGYALSRSGQAAY